MDKWFKLFVFLSAIVCGGAVPAAAAELLSTHPSHYARPGASGQGGGSSIFGRTKQVRTGSRVVVRDEDPLPQRWRLDQALSRACNHRAFRQKRDKFLIGVVDGRTYGAAVGGHGSLIDRVKMAEKQVIYLFRGQGTTDCRVYRRSK